MYLVKISILKKTISLVVLFLGLTVSQFSAAQTETFESFTEVQSGLITAKKGSTKQAMIEWLANSLDQEKAKSLLQPWLDGNLYFRKDDQALFVIDNFKEGQNAQAIADQSIITISNKRDFSKIRTNNSLRSEIRDVLARMDISADDPAVRLAAVNSLLGTSSPKIMAALSEQYDLENDSEVQEAIKLALAINQVKTSQNVAEQLDAIDIISASTQSEVYGALNQIIHSDADESVIKAAQLGLNKFQQKQSLYGGVETVFFGLSLGSVLVLAGIGLAITFGVMGVINMAHGELIMIGAYTTYVMQQLMPNNIGAALLLSIPAAFVVSGLVGILIERTVIRRLYGRPLETLLATFGISLILQQAVRSIFSPLNRSVSTPDWMSGALNINPMLSLTYNRLYIILFCFMVFLGLLAVLKKTPLGLQVRAVSQNRSMARAMGVRSERVDAMTFGLGSGIAGIAGVALSQLTNVGPNMGQNYIIDSFMVVVFGGVGNLWGTLVAGLSLGLFNKILEPWAGAVLAKILVLVFIILFIQKRPKGLFPQRGRAAE
ncbi:urea ABC transporter permease subunit UrtB [Vibrio rumoiensis]|uniref:Urea ABC transporter permease subunit UrtB n=1 Tax=Vibrio rumoiensis 1S-45 TaxID=1188252 RepID=A0A1E5E2N0_9VIBR|nr:urea ABC transporter permease subunit UrtB [Vibrio rumoiensis]OEF25785.1 urea ABC transporter permease subunit UrtB [Vibrio rumoiensis 1S-45]